MKDVLDLPFDQYQRYRLVADLLRVVRGGGPPLRVLDVGGRTAVLRSFVGDARVDLVDLEPSDAQGLVLGDGSRLPFADQSFDAALAFDTLEHVPPPRRRAFVEECARVSRRWVILAGPYAAPRVVEAEQLLQRFLKDKLGIEHRYLDEHRHHGLPERAAVEGWLAARGAKVASIGHGNLDRWLVLQCLSMYLDYDPALRPLASAFQRFYNRALYDSDHAEPVYRHVVVAALGGARLPRADELLGAPRAPAGALAPFTELVPALAVFDRERESWRAERALLVRATEELERDVEGHRASLHDVENDLTEHRKALALVTSDVTEHRRALEAVTADLEGHRAALAHAEELRAALAAELAREQREAALTHGELWTELGQHRRAVETLTTDLEGHRHSLARARETLDAERGAHAQVRADLERDLDGHRAALAALSADLDGHRSALADARRASDEERRAREAERRAGEEARAALERDLAGHRSALEETRRSLAEEQRAGAAARAALEGDLREHRNVLATLTADLAGHRQALADARGEIAALRAELARSDAELRRSVALASGLETSLAAREELYDRLHRELSSRWRNFKRVFRPGL